MKLWNDLLHLFFPRLCLLCDEPLVEGEKTLCLSCLYSLPRTHFHKRPFNPAEQLFAGKTPVTKATSYLYYEKGGKVQQLIYAIKYRGEKEAGFQMGKLAAAELYKEDFFEGIDLIIPVQLHPGRQRRRGYNQAESIARGSHQCHKYRWTAVRWYGNGRPTPRHIRMCSSGGPMYRIFFT